MDRYAAKLLFAYQIAGSSLNEGTTCEERIINFYASTSKSALAIAQRQGAAAVYQFENSDGEQVVFQFVGIMDLLQLGIECEANEVWYGVYEVDESPKLPNDEDLLSRC